MAVLAIASLRRPPFSGRAALASAPGLDALQRVAQAALLAAEVPGVVDGPTAVVDGDRRVRAERTGAIDRARRRRVRRDDRLGRDAALHPALERGERVEGIGAGPTAAVVHPGREEEAEELVCLVLVAHRTGHIVVVLD